MADVGEITVLLRDWRAGDPTAIDHLFELVYPQLRQIAGALFRGERPENLLLELRPGPSGDDRHLDDRQERAEERCRLAIERRLALRQGAIEVEHDEPLHASRSPSNPFTGRGSSRSMES